MFSVMNKPCVYLVCEDQRNVDFANGFRDYKQINQRRLKMESEPAGGRAKTPALLKKEYIARLKKEQESHVVVFLDFDAEAPHEKINKCLDDAGVDYELRSRVYFLGTRKNPEAFRNANSQNASKSYEELGKQLAEACAQNNQSQWLEDDHLKHNEPELVRLISNVRPILFDC
jgi:hypothetical protein